MPSVTVLGATGYTGREFVKLALGHPRFSLEQATTTSRAGTRLADVHPELRGRTDLVLETFDPATASAHDAVVSCLPHKESMAIVAQLTESSKPPKIVDLSADFRFPDAATYEAAYHTPHTSPALAAKSAYGLPELFRNQIPKATVVGNPGCYPTSALLALAPVARAGALAEAIVDAKSGISGAGAHPGPATHFPKANESMTAYKPFGHRHQPEIATHLARVAGASVPLTFTPHLVPMDRGILSTIYADLNEATDKKTVAAWYEQAYAKEPFVRLLPSGEMADTKWVSNTNFCDLGWALSPDGTRLLITSAIDNLVKGASGQALQNLNLLFGFSETLGMLSEPRRTTTKVPA